MERQQTTYYWSRLIWRWRDTLFSSQYATRHKFLTMHHYQLDTPLLFLPMTSSPNVPASFSSTCQHNSVNNLETPSAPTSGTSYSIF